jgi:D-3-phosphoglycerate dehydrogenase / 2-oxoglutarate reductase
LYATSVFTKKIKYPMRIAILDDYQDAVRKLECFKLLDGHDIKIFNNTVKGVGQLSVRLRDAEALVLIRERTQISSQLIEKLPQLRLIAQTGRVGQHLDVAACTQAGVAVAEGAGDPTAPAELAWALIMSAQRRIPQYVASLKHGAWQQSGLRTSSMPANFGLGRALKGQTLGIWGFGRIGRLVAGYGKAFGMQVQVWGSAQSMQEAKALGYTASATREAFFESSNVLSLHLRLSDSTQGIVTAADFARMRPDAVFVNTARAELVAPDALVHALIAALNRGRPCFAAIDVFDSEPILQGHPLLRIENALCTPHLGFVERNSYEMYFAAAFEAINAFAAGTPVRVVNPDALKVKRKR